MKTEELIFNTAESIEDAQRVQVALENTQYDLWRNFKKAVATQIDVKPTIPFDNNIDVLGYDTENGKRLNLYFNLDMNEFAIPKFHIEAGISNIGQDTLEEIFMITNISTLVNRNSFEELAKKYADWIKKQLEANKN